MPSARLSSKGLPAGVPTDLIGSGLPGSIDSWDRVNQVVAVMLPDGSVVMEETLTNKVIARIPAAHVKDAAEVLASLITD